jgi:ligand-binding sensor domain-containing protein
LPSGDIHSFEPETGNFVVDPNAIFSDGQRLYIGTLGGLRVLDLTTQEWKTVRDILPSETVMAITGSADSIYFGTTSGIAVVNKSFFEKKNNEG